MSTAKIDKAINTLQLHYYINIIIVCLCFILIFFKIVSLTNNPQTLSMALNQYSIIFSLLIIPAVLKYYSHQIKKATPTNIEQAFRVYKSAFYMRLYPISLVITGNILLYALSNNTNYIWIALAIILFMFFCKPSVVELDNLIEKSKANE